jgi:hypothetical protein
LKSGRRKERKVGNDFCLLYGAVISLVIHFIKAHIPIIDQYPKITASVIAAAVAAAQAGLGDAATVTTVLSCVATQLVAAVGTHEIVTKPVSKAVNREGQ